MVRNCIAVLFIKFPSRVRPKNASCMCTVEVSSLFFWYEDSVMHAMCKQVVLIPGLLVLEVTDRQVKIRWVEGLEPLSEPEPT